MGKILSAAAGVGGGSGTFVIPNPGTQVVNNHDIAVAEPLNAITGTLALFALTPRLDVALTCAETGHTEGVGVQALEATEYGLTLAITNSSTVPIGALVFELGYFTGTSFSVSSYADFIQWDAVPVPTCDVPGALGGSAGDASMAWEFSPAWAPGVTGTFTMQLDVSDGYYYPTGGLADAIPVGARTGTTFVFTVRLRALPVQTAVIPDTAIVEVAVPTSVPAGVTSLLFSPHPDEAYIWTREETDAHVLMRTVDGGTTWGRVYTESAGFWGMGSSVDFAQLSNTEYITCGRFQLPDGVGGPYTAGVAATLTTYIAGTGSNRSNILRTTDGGVTWTPDTWNLDAIARNQPWQRLKRLDNGRIVAGVYDSVVSHPRLYLSDDGGHTWAISTPLPGAYDARTDYPTVLGLEDMGHGVVLASMVFITDTEKAPTPMPRSWIWRSTDYGFHWTEVKAIAGNGYAPLAGLSSFFKVAPGVVLTGGYAFATAVNATNQTISTLPPWRLSLDHGGSFLIKPSFDAFPLGSSPSTIAPVAQMCLTDDGHVMSAHGLEEINTPGNQYIYRGTLKRDMAILRTGRVVPTVNIEYTYTLQANQEDFGRAGEQTHQRGKRNILISVQMRLYNGRMGQPAVILAQNPTPTMAGVRATVTYPVSGALLIDWSHYVAPALDFDHWEVFVGVGASIDPTQFTRTFRRNVDQNNVLVEGLGARQQVAFYIMPYDSFGAGVPSTIQVVTTT